MCFSTGQRLARQRRLLDLQVDRLDQPRRRPATLSPGLSSTTSPGTSSRAGISDFLAVAQHGAVGAAISRSASMARSARYSWTKPSSTANSTITAMATASIAMAEERRERRRDEQDDDQDVLELLEQERPGRDAPGGLQLVRPVLGQPARRLGAAQSRQAGLQVRQRGFDGLGMPVCSRNSSTVSSQTFLLPRLSHNFVNSSATAGTSASPSTTCHSRRLSGCVLKIGCRNGTNTTASSSTSDSATAPSMYLFERSPSGRSTAAPSAR